MEEEGMTPGYFGSIHAQLFATVNASWANQDRLHHVIPGIGILKVFQDVAERPLIVALKLIWPKDFTSLSLLLEQTGGGGETVRPISMCIQDFDSVMSELEGMILQTRRQIKGWYLNHLIYSSSMSMLRCKSTDITQVSDFLKEFKYILMSFYYSIHDKIHRSQIDSLTNKLSFLGLKLVYVMIYVDGKEEEINEFLNFIGDFTNSAACLTCLHWAKEGDGAEVASEMNIFTFDMLQKVIPYASRIIPLYVGIFKDCGQSGPGFLPLNEAVESFVDFFFEHLAIILKDDFPFLRDRLILLFKFLTNPSSENVEEKGRGGDSIPNQVCSVLREDVYLLLSFDEMNKDFSDKKVLLRGFMTRIEVATAKIRLLSDGSSSSSQITLDVEKMECDYFASVLKELSRIEECHPEGADKKEIQLYIVELRFLRVFLLCFATWDDTDEEIKVILRSMISCFRGIWGVKEGERLLAHRIHALPGAHIITDWHPLALELQGKIQLSKLESEAWCVNFFHSLFQLKTSTSYNILEFLESIVANLNDLVIYKASEIGRIFKKQIETLKEKLMFLMNFLNLASNCKDFEELGEFRMLVQAFANDAACLTILYWSKGVNVEIISMLSHMLQNIKPATRDVARLYFRTLVAIYIQRSSPQLFGKVAYSFAEFFLEDTVTDLKGDFQILQDNIVFLLTFLNDPPNQNAEDSICSRIDVNFWYGLYRLLPFVDMEDGFSMKKRLLNDFMMKIEAINANIRHVYGKFPDSSLYNFPKVISPQFFDFLMQNLRNLKDRMNSDRSYVPFARYKIMKIEEELAIFPFFVNLFDLQIELNETWLEVVDVLYLTEYVIMSCISSLFVFDKPFWYHMAYLSNVFDEIKAVKAKLERMKLEYIMSNAKCLPSSVDLISNQAEQGRPSEINEIVVGFEDEIEKITGMLTCGPKSLDIVSIVGMGGLGKTTLAKKIFGSALVKSHFNVFAFCSVSLDYNVRKLLQDIIRDIKGGDDITREMTNDDLAHHLWKCLSRQRYLVVFDDIWNVRAWTDVKSSFPDDENGSRVMFTTRSLEVADKCIIKCSPHQLRFLNEVESWEVLRNKVFRNDISPPYLGEIGKRVAKNCKGLPLALNVIGGLLSKTEKSLRWWCEVADGLSYHLSTEGCMEILDLSYKHSPENLKPCLLYLGAFPEDRLMRVKNVIQLWIAEGFIQESMTKSLEDVATDYFQALVDRSFIMVVERSSDGGGIKTFYVHDLIRDLCQMKCRASNFFQLNYKIEPSGIPSEPPINNHYRASLQDISDVAIADGLSYSNARTLHFFSYDHGVIVTDFLLKKFRLVQVLGLDPTWVTNDINQLATLIHARYIDATLKLNGNSIPSSISNLWNLTCLKLRLHENDTVQLPETFWRMKSLRHVKVANCILIFPDEDIIMNKVVSFSKPVLSTGKDIERLLRRLPVVKKLSCDIKKPDDCDETSIETLDFHRALESLVLTDRSLSWNRGQYMINFPPSLKKLTLQHFKLPWTALSAIAELQCLEVLKLRYNLFVETTLETEDLIFVNLKFFELYDRSLEEWNASTESFPCLQQLEIECEKLNELPPCFGESSTLKSIRVTFSSPEIEDSARRIQEELVDAGIQLQLTILNNTYYS